MSASVVASVVGIASGVNALTGGGITSMFGGGGSSGGSGGAAGQTSGTYDPYGQYRQGDAATLQGYMKDPSSAMAEPGYQQTLQQGMDATSRGMVGCPLQVNYSLVQNRQHYRQSVRTHSVLTIRIN